MSTNQSEADIATQIYTASILKAAQHQLPLAELIVNVTLLGRFDQKRMVAELYKTWIAYYPDDSLISIAYFNYGVILTQLADYTGAINALRECIKLNPSFYSPYINLGRVLEDLGQIPLALAQWSALVERLADINADSVSHKVLALQQLGRVLKGAHALNAAEDVLKKSLDINPAQIDVIQNWIALRQGQCKWPVLAGWERVPKEKLTAAIYPLSLLNLSDDPMFHLAKAYHHCLEAVGVPKWPAKPYVHDVAARSRPERLRIGYVSSDLRDHAVGFAMTDVVETHDRARFEVFAYYCGINRPDVTQERIKRGVDHWIDLTGMSDEQAAARMFEDRIDILLDLNGYTNSARTKIFALRPAPVIVNWFGFPCTMGSPYHHYIIADATIIPSASEIYYSEKVMRLPCYQPNDRNRSVAVKRPSREDERLPEKAFVFCCLNGLQKLTALTFERWMVILAGVPDSVLWLLTGSAETDAHLRQMAAQKGIAPERLIFAERMPNPEHLARYPLADLFLDNLPYGAHTTAADAMWMGVPILTLLGRSFASRVCASLVEAAGVGELVCTTPDAYVARAIELGRNRPVFAAVKKKLMANRDTCVLFDTPRLVGALEGLYRQMWADYENGSLPVPDLSNLDIYHAVAQDLDLEATELLSDAAYVTLYEERLAVWNMTYPIRPDSRFWKQAR